jgi:hypothetical protein
MAITFPTSGTTGIGIGTTGTSGTFSPGAGTVIFVFVASHDQPSFTISNSGTALTWTKRVELIGGEAGVLQIWSAPNTNAQSNITVTATANSSSIFLVKPVVGAGVDTSTPTGATGTDDTTGGNNYTQNLYTSTVNNSVGIALGIDNNNASNSSLPTSTDGIFTTLKQSSNLITGMALSKSSATATAGTSVPFTFNCSNTGVDWLVAAVEVLPAPEVQTVSPSGISSGEAIGTAQLNLTISPSGISTSEALGTSQLNLTLTASGIASAEAFGTADVGAISPAGISSEEAFGVPLVTYQQFVSPTGIPSGEAVGTPEDIFTGYPQDVLPTGIESLERVPEPLVGLLSKLVVRPPTIQETPAGPGRFFSRFGIHRGISIVKRNDDTYYQTRYPSQVEIEETQAIYLGGAVTEVSVEEAASLTAAGFGSYVFLEDIE